MSKLVSPSEIESFYLLPTIRKELTRHLKDQGLDQKEIARKLHITEPAVSQYVNSKRASQVIFDRKIDEEIQKSAVSIKTGANFIEESTKLLRLVKDHRFICNVCHSVNTDTKIIPHNCDVCFRQ